MAPCTLGRSIEGQLFPGPQGITLYITGDSTTGINPSGAKTGDKISWADVFGHHINGNVCKMQNEARPGHSLRDYFHRGILDGIFRKVRVGDIFLACHGHLEGTPLTRKAGRARGCLPGFGDQTVTVYDAFFKREEIIHTFDWYLREYIRRCEDAGAVLVLLSPPVRFSWANGMVVRTQSLAYAQAMKAVCNSQRARVLDFGLLTENYLNTLGVERGSVLYLNENERVHTNLLGAQAYANLLAINLTTRFPEVFLGIFNDLGEK